MYKVGRVNTEVFENMKRLTESNKLKLMVETQTFANVIQQAQKLNINVKKYYPQVGIEDSPIADILFHLDYLVKNVRDKVDEDKLLITPVYVNDSNGDTTFCANICKFVVRNYLGQNEKVLIVSPDQERVDKMVQTLALMKE